MVLVLDYCFHKMLLSKEKLICWDRDTNHTNYFYAIFQTFENEEAPPEASKEGDDNAQAQGIDE